MLEADGDISFCVAINNDRISGFADEKVIVDHVHIVRYAAVATASRSQRGKRTNDEPPVSVGICLSVCVVTRRSDQNRFTGTRHSGGGLSTRASIKMTSFLSNGD